MQVLRPLGRYVFVLVSSDHEGLVSLPVFTIVHPFSCFKPIQLHYTEKSLPFTIMVTRKWFCKRWDHAHQNLRLLRIETIFRCWRSPTSAFMYLTSVEAEGHPGTQPILVQKNLILYQNMIDHFCRQQAGIMESFPHKLLSAMAYFDSSWQCEAIRSGATQPSASLSTSRVVVMTSSSCRSLERLYSWWLHALSQYWIIL